MFLLLKSNYVLKLKLLLTTMRLLWYIYITEVKTYHIKLLWENNLLKKQEQDYRCSYYDTTEIYI